jgi:predicted nucleic acid-binding protein
LADALQISTALSAGCEVFLTNDVGMKGITGMDVIILNEI